MTLFFRSRTVDHGVVKSIWRRARQGLSDHMSPIPMEDTTYFRSCCTMLERYCMIIFTRESGYHACGWWKNPLYDRCFHLSLSFRIPVYEVRINGNNHGTLHRLRRPGDRSGRADA